MQPDPHTKDLRFAPNGRAYQKPMLRARDHEIIRMSLLGYKNKEIAAVLGVTPATISLTLNSGPARTYISMLSAARDLSTVDISARLLSLAPRCVEFLSDEVLENENAPIHLRAKTANDLLGLAGHVRPQRIQITGQIAHVTPADLEEIKLRARQAAAECGLLVDYTEAEFNEVKPVDGQQSTQEGQAPLGDGESQQAQSSCSVATDDSDDSKESVDVGHK